MRVSSKSIQMQWLSVLSKQQADVARLQQQVGSGRRINSAVDDPVGAAQVTLFQQGLDRIQSFATNADTAQRRLSLEESSLDQATDILTRARELAVQAGGAPAVAPEARQAIANEVKELLTSMVDVANAQDGEGRYLFAGNKVQTRPFERTGNLVVYVGDQDTRAQRISDDRLIQENDAGTTVFSDIRNGNGTFSVSANAANQGNVNYSTASVIDSSAWVPGTYTVRFIDEASYDIVDGSGTTISSGINYASGGAIAFNGIAVGLQGEPVAGDEFTISSSRKQDVFTTLRKFVTTLENDVNSPADRAQFQSSLNSSLLDLEQALNNINEVRSNVGARLNAIDSQRGVNEEVAFQLETSLSAVQDLDYASAIAELQLQLLSLETAQKSFAQTQRTSLFDYL